MKPLFVKIAYVAGYGSKYAVWKSITVSVRKRARTYFWKVDHAVDN